MQIKIIAKLDYLQTKKERQTTNLQFPFMDISIIQNIPN